MRKPMPPTAHLIYVPTHRACLAVIDEQIQEALWIQSQGLDTYLCVLDNAADYEVTTANRWFFEQRRPAGLRQAYLDREQQAELVDVILSHLPPEAGADIDTAKQLLLPGGTSYGRGPNLAALLG